MNYALDPIVPLFASVEGAIGIHSLKKFLICYGFWGVFTTEEVLYYYSAVKKVKAKQKDDIFQGGVEVSLSLKLTLELVILYCMLLNLLEITFYQSCQTHGPWAASGPWICSIWPVTLPMG